MSAFKKVLVGTAGLAAVIGLASPAAAQYYPNTGSGYGSSVGNAVGRAIDGVVAATQYGYAQPGYSQYGYSQPYGNYGQPYGNYGQAYGNAVNSHPAVGQCASALQSRGGYGGAYGGARITGIRNIEPRNNGAVRVNGSVSTYTGYGYGAPNMTFSCKVDRNGRVTDLRIDRDNYGANGYNDGYRRW